MQNNNSDNSLDSIFQAENPTVIFITAENCGPCRTMKPIFNKVSQAFTDEIDFFFVDGHLNIDAVKKFGVRTVPETFLIKNGKVQHRISGLAPEEGLLSAIKGHLLRKPQNLPKLDFEL